MSDVLDQAAREALLARELSEQWARLPLTPDLVKATQLPLNLTVSVITSGTVWWAILNRSKTVAFIPVIDPAIGRRVFCHQIKPASCTTAPLDRELYKSERLLAVFE